MYVLVADDTDKVYTSTHTWRPQLYDYQAKGTNTLFLTFLNPARMPDVPPAFAALAKSRGTGSPGAVPNSTTVMFAIGGQAYSERPNPWDWYVTRLLSPYRPHPPPARAPQRLRSCPAARAARLRSCPAA
jgi:hypothetical protein